MIELLVNNGADINAETISGRTPLHEFFVMGMDDNGGVETGPSVRSSFTSTTDYKSFQRDQALAIRCMLQWFVAVIKRLYMFIYVYTLILFLFTLSRGADPTIQDRKGYAAVHYCCREDNLPCLMEFLNYLVSADHFTVTAFTLTPTQLCTLNVYTSIHLSISFLYGCMYTGTP